MSGVAKRSCTIYSFVIYLLTIMLLPTWQHRPTLCTRARTHSSCLLMRLERDVLCFRIAACLSLLSDGVSRCQHIQRTATQMDAGRWDCPLATHHLARSAVRASFRVGSVYASRRRNALLLAWMTVRSLWGSERPLRRHPLVDTLHRKPSNRAEGNSDQANGIHPAVLAELLDFITMQ
jgi:hypothetical protein